MPLTKKPIGEILVDNGQITPEELALATRECKHTGEPMSVVLARLGLAYEHHLKNALELQYGVTYVSLTRVRPEYDIISAVPEQLMRRHMLVPVSRKGNRVTVAMVDPNYSEGLDVIKKFFDDAQLTAAVCTEDEFTQFMEGPLKELLVPPKKEERKIEKVEQAPEPAPVQAAAEPKPEKKRPTSLKDLLNEAMQDERTLTAAETPDEPKQVKPPDEIKPVKPIEEPKPAPVEEEALALKPSEEPKASSPLRFPKSRGGSKVTDTGETLPVIAPPEKLAEPAQTEKPIEEKKEPAPASENGAKETETETVKKASDTGEDFDAFPDKEKQDENETTGEKLKKLSQDSPPPPVIESTGEYRTLNEPGKGTAVEAFPECVPEPSESSIPAAAKDKPVESLAKEAEDAAVVMLCNQILANAIAKGATTVHIQALERQVLVHYRMAGQMMVVRKLPRILYGALAGRFRKMGRVEGQDSRLPQDGRIKVRMSGRDFSLRLSIIPGQQSDHITVWIE